MAVPAKKRKMNFSEREVEIIVEELELKKHLLVNHFNAGVPLAAKSAAWHGILRRVNAVATCRRELPEVKKKWSDLKTEVRRKVAQVRAAVEGGEPQGPLRKMEQVGPGQAVAVAPVAPLWPLYCSPPCNNASATCWVRPPLSACPVPQRSTPWPLDPQPLQPPPQSP